MTDDDIREIPPAADAEDPTDPDETPSIEEAAAADDAAADAAADDAADAADDAAGDDAAAADESLQETTVLPLIEADGAEADADLALEPATDAVFAEPLPGESELIPLDPEEAAQADAAAEAAAVAAVPAAEASAEPTTDAPAEQSATDAAATPAETPAEPPLMDFGPERRDNTWIWWALTGIALLATIGVGIWWYASLRTVPVPNLVGQKTVDAVFAIADAGLELGDAAEVSTDTVPPGQVVGQKPDAGTQLHPGDTVSLLISKPPVTSKVPDIKQKTREEAEETLAKASLRPYIVRSYSPTVAADYVISQLPSAGVELDPGSTVAVAVSQGQAPTSIRVPNLFGMSAEDAQQLLQSLNLIGSQFRSIDPSKTAGTIVNQAPAAGSAVKFNERVMFVVADRGATTPVTVPSVVGSKRKAAETTLKGKSLKPQITYVPDARVPKDEVIRQMPFAGSKAAKGSAVGLLVSRGATETLIVPDAVGRSSADAESIIKKGGFSPAPVLIKLPGVTAGMTVAQFPAAGSQWYYRFPVIVLVGKL